MISKRVTCSKAHHFGYPAVTFRGCMPAAFQKDQKMDFQRSERSNVQTSQGLQPPSNCVETHRSNSQQFQYHSPVNLRLSCYRQWIFQRLRFSATPNVWVIKTSWWFQPIWKICSSKWVHLPQSSGWKNMYLKPWPKIYVSQKKNLQKSHALKILLGFFWTRFYSSRGYNPNRGWYYPIHKSINLPGFLLYDNVAIQQNAATNEMKQSMTLFSPPTLAI